MATKKSSTKKNAKPRDHGVKTSARTIAELRLQLAESARELQDCKRQHAEKLREALEREAATRKILAMIAKTAADLPSIIDAIAENAADLCDAKDALIFRVDGDVHHRVTVYGSIPAPAFGLAGPATRGTPVGRAIVDARTIHVPDILTDLETEFPEYKAIQLATGTRSMLSTPMLKDGVPLGVIHIRRTEVRPFTEEQINLLETFADQAVIAIENVRLFRELQERNAELREALEHQTATAEVLGIISRSPTDVQPVFDAIVESAARVCGIDDVVLRLSDGDSMVARAHFGSIPISRVEIDLPILAGCASREHGTLHVPDPARRTIFQ